MPRSKNAVKNTNVDNVDEDEPGQRRGIYDLYAEQIQINGNRLSRIESPALEGSAAKTIEEAFRDLIERRYLYQKIDVDFAPIRAAVKSAVAQAKKCQMENARVSLETSHSSSAPPIQELTEKQLMRLRDEVASRPWRVATRHLGDGLEGMEIRRLARIGAQTLGVDDDAMNLNFYLPSVQLHCSAECKSGRTFVPLASSTDSGFESPYPRKKDGKTEQVYIADYRCETCRQSIFTVLIRRVGLRLHLCGFAPRRELIRNNTIPEELTAIFHDAEQAVAEGDIYAGFYHLRTLLEHYLKTKLEIPILQRIRGEDLVSDYNAKLPPGITGMLPSFSTAFQKLSDWLHSRTGEAEDYQMLREDICKHIQVVEALGPQIFTTAVTNVAAKIQSTS